MEAPHMTNYGVTGISEVLTALNDNLTPDTWWQFEIQVSVDVKNKEGEDLGRITFNEDEGEYVFVPGPTGWAPYAGAE